MSGRARSCIPRPRSSTASGPPRPLDQSRLRSFLHNYELNAVVLGPEFGKQMQTMFDRDLTASEAITLEQRRRRPLDQRFTEWLARVWKYWP